MASRPMDEWTSCPRRWPRRQKVEKEKGRGKRKVGKNSILKFRIFWDPPPPSLGGRRALTTSLPQVLKGSICYLQYKMTLFKWNFIYYLVLHFWSFKKTWDFIKVGVIKLYDIIIWVYWFIRDRQIEAGGSIPDGGVGGRVAYFLAEVE